MLSLQDMSILLFIGMTGPVAIGKLERHVRKASHRGSKQQ